MTNTDLTRKEKDILVKSISHIKTGYEGDYAYYEECFEERKGDRSCCDHYKRELALTQQRIKEIDSILLKLRKKKRKAKSNKCTCQGLQHRTNCPKWVLCF